MKVAKVLRPERIPENEKKINKRTRNRKKELVNISGSIE